MNKIIKIIKIIISIGICIFMLLTLFGCNTTDEQDNSKDLLTIYVVNEHPIIRLIEEYNDSTTSAKINVVDFQDNETLNSKLSAELMAGKGPDIVLYDSNYNGVSNIEKMMALDVFADYNELIKATFLTVLLILIIIMKIYWIQEFTMVNAFLCQYHIFLIF